MQEGRSVRKEEDRHQAVIAVRLPQARQQQAEKERQQQPVVIQQEVQQIAEEQQQQQDRQHQAVHEDHVDTEDQDDIWSF